MGGSSSRESEVRARVIAAVESGHAHTLKLMLHFVQHAPGGPPKEQTQSKAATTTTAPLNAPATHSGAMCAGAWPLRPALPSSGALDEAQASFHARAAALAQQQALEAGLNSASFPIPLDLDALRANDGSSLLVAAVRAGQDAMVRLLAVAGTEVDTLDIRGLTPMHHAALANSQSCAEVLLRAHACSIIHSKDGLLASQMTTAPGIKALLEDAEARDQLRLLQMLMEGAGLSSPMHALFDGTTSVSFPLHLYRLEVAREVPCVPSASTVQIDVYFRGPMRRNAADCICLYYVDDTNAPQTMRPRMGSVFYLSEIRGKTGACVPPSLRASNDASPIGLGWDSISVTMKLAGLPMQAYRFVYFDSARQQVLAASDICTLRTASQHETSSLPGSPALNTAATTGGSSVFSFLNPAPTPTPAAHAPSAHTTSGPASPSLGSPAVSLHPDFLTLTSGAFGDASAKFLVAPPSYFLSHFTLNLASVKLALQLDPALAVFCSKLVPSRMDGQTFWTRYFWNMNKLSIDDVRSYPKPELTVIKVVVEAATADSHAQQSTYVAPSAAASSTPYTPPSAITKDSLPPAHPTSSPAHSPSSSVTLSSGAAAVSSASSPLSSFSSSSAATSSSARRPASKKGDDEDDDDSSYVPPSFAALPIA